MEYRVKHDEMVIKMASKVVTGIPSMYLVEGEKSCRMQISSTGGPALL